MLLFFNDHTVAQAVRDLGTAKQLTVIVGAGSSMEIGLPSWENLVLRLLDDAIEARGWSDDREGFREAARRSGLLITAELVGSLLGADMSEAIKARLYEGADLSELRPGPLARSIAGLQHEFGPAMRLATTNYDDLLERALLERGPTERWWTGVRSLVSPGPIPARAVAVMHLHGLLGKIDRGRIVLSESDYQRMQLRRSWQEKWAIDALSQTACLFVGASLTDANLIRYLYGAGLSRHRHVALFRRLPAPTTGEARFRARLEEAERSRWTRLGITPLYADDFAEVAQFVHEVGHRRRLGNRYVSLPDRLETWFRGESEAGSLYRSEDKGYVEIQQHLHANLKKLCDDVRQLLSAHHVDVAGEKLAVALLSLFPAASPGGPERVVVLATSDRIMTAVDSIAPIPLLDQSDWTGVKVICRGSPLYEAKDVYASRWRYVLGFPVYTDGVRTPLGAVTIASMSSSSGLVLDRMPAECRLALAELMGGSARALLTMASGG